MADDGFGVTITFGTSGFLANLIEIDPPEWTREAYETTHHGTTVGRSYKPVDLEEPGEISGVFEFNPDTDPPIGAVLETITLTWPIPAGSSNGATWARDGFLTKYKPNAPISDRMTADFTIKWSGDITITAAS